MEYEQWSCPICHDMDPLCLLVTCEERRRAFQRRECVGSIYGKHVPSETRKGVCAACDQPFTGGAV